MTKSLLLVSLALCTFVGCQNAESTQATNTLPKDGSDNDGRRSDEICQIELSHIDAKWAKFTPYMEDFINKIQKHCWPSPIPIPEKGEIIVSLLLSSEGRVADEKAVNSTYNDPYLVSVFTKAVALVQTGTWSTEMIENLGNSQRLTLIFRLNRVSPNGLLNQSPRSPPSGS